VTIGWDRMSHRARMSDKAAKRNLTSLMATCLCIPLFRWRLMDSNVYFKFWVCRPSRYR
jgi:hypothetical protein